MREAPRKNFGIFSILTKFDKRWSAIMIMLDSSEGGGTHYSIKGESLKIMPTVPLQIYLNQLFNVFSDLQ